MPLDEVLREPPEDIGERVLLALDCANERRIGPSPALLDARGARRRRRPPPRQHALRRRQPDRRRRLLDRRDRPRPARGAGRRADARDRRGALRRRSSPTPAASSTRTRPRRRCGSRPSWSRPAPTSTASSSSVYETVQFAKLKLLARALERAQVYEGGRLRRLVPARAPTSPRSGRRSRTRRGSSTTCARPRARSWSALIREPPARPAARRTASRSARAATRSTSPRSRAARRRRPPAGGGLLERATRSRRSSTSSAASSSPRQRRASPMPPRARRPVGVALVDKPAGPSSFALVAGASPPHAARAPGTRARSTRSRPGLLVLLSGRGN